ENFCAEAFKNLFTFYKSGDFTVSELQHRVEEIYHESDLIIIDHVHYFDWAEDNDNRALKEIIKAIRDIALQKAVPVILVAHLRKRDRNNKDLVPGMEEFQGSS